MKFDVLISYSGSDFSYHRQMSVSNNIHEFVTLLHTHVYYIYLCYDEHIAVQAVIIHVEPTFLIIGEKVWRFTRACRSFRCFKLYCEQFLLPKGCMNVWRVCLYSFCPTMRWQNNIRSHAFKLLYWSWICIWNRCIFLVVEYFTAIGSDCRFDMRCM